MENYCLAEVKCPSGVGGATSRGLALICIDIACTQLGEPFDRVSPCSTWWQYQNKQRICCSYSL